MKIILTVTGIDHEGIIAAVTTKLTERHVNVLDVSQTIMGELQESMTAVEHAQKVQIRIQAETIFKAMHSI